MTILKMYPSSLNENYLDLIIKSLKNGGVVIYPTDSLYALGCDASNGHAVEKICRLKNVDPRKSTLSIICCDISQAAEYARIDNNAFKILKEHLPGHSPSSCRHRPRYLKYSKAERKSACVYPTTI